MAGKDRRHRSGGGDGRGCGNRPDGEGAAPVPPARRPRFRVLPPVLAAGAAAPVSPPGGAMPAPSLESPHWRFPAGLASAAPPADRPPAIPSPDGGRPRDGVRQGRWPWPPSPAKENARTGRCAPQAGRFRRMEAGGRYRWGRRTGTVGASVRRIRSNERAGGLGRRLDPAEPAAAEPAEPTHGTGGD